MFDARYIVEVLRMLRGKYPKPEADQLVQQAMLIMQVNDLNELAVRLNAEFAQGARNFLPVQDLVAWGMAQAPALTAHLSAMIATQSKPVTLPFMLACCSLALLLQACAMFQETFDNHLLFPIYNEALFFLDPANA